MNSYNPSVWSSSPFFNQYYGLIQIHGNLFQSQQYSHQSYHDSKQTSVMSYSDYSTNHHSGKIVVLTEKSRNIYF